MYTIIDMWITVSDDGIYEPKGYVSGIYELVDDAVKALNDHMMKCPNNECDVTKINEGKYVYLSPDGKTRGCIKISQITY